MKTLAQQRHIHPKTQKTTEILAESVEDIQRFSETLVKADDVVGAQFYYSNPILFILVQGDMTDHAQLYGDYYLLHVESWQDIEMAHPIIAVNDVFLEHIGDAESYFDLDANAFEELYKQHGLYIVGILKN